MKFDIKAEIHIHHHDAEVRQQISELGDRIMAAIDDLNAQLDAVVTNIGEQATEVARIRVEIEALRDLAVNGVSPADATAFGARLDALVDSTQAVETSLRETTAST